MATNWFIWDRNEKVVVGSTGCSPTLYPSSAAATAAIDRVNRHNGGKAASKVFDVVSVTVN